MEKSIFNKKKWIKNHLEQILTKKKEGLTHQAIIQCLIDHEKMPFELSESLLSRYLKDFCGKEPSVSKENEQLKGKILRQNDRLKRQNNELQDLKRRFERVQERNITLDARNYSLSERNKVMENKFLDGEARLKDLRRYNGYNNVHWKVADLEQKNDDLYQTILYLERRCEVIAEPLERTIEQLEQVTADRDKILEELTVVRVSLEQEQEKLRDTVQKLDYATKAAYATEQELVAVCTNLEELKTQMAQGIQSENSQELVLIRTKLAEEQEKNKSLVQKNYDLNMAGKRFKDDVAILRSELQQAQEKAEIEQNRANQGMIWRYGLLTVIAILVVTLMFIVL